MNVDPRQYDPEFQDSNAADTERKSQFGMQSQADMPLTSGAGTGATNTPASAPAWGQRDVLASAPVYGSDDKKIGTVQESYKESFKVKSGILITHELYYPYSAIARSDPERIVLNLTSDEAKQENWRQRPSMNTTGANDATGMGGAAGTSGMAGMGADAMAGSAAGGMAGGAMAAGTPAYPTSMPQQTTGEYGIYGPEGPEDTMQSATERGAQPDDADDANAPSAIAMPPAASGAGRLPSGADTATPTSPSATAAPMQGDMAYRGIVGPNNEPGAPDRAYNPGLQGADAAGQENSSGLLPPEQDPTSWNADQPPSNTGV